MNRPLVQIAIGWLIGVICFQITGSQWFLYMCGIIIFLVIGVCFFTKRISWTSYVIICLASMVSGFLYSFTFLQNHSHLPIKQGESVYVLGTIQSKPIRDGDQLRFDLQLLQIQYHNQLIKSSERIRVLIKLESIEQWRQAQQVQRGWVIQARLNLEKPPLPRNPGAFNYAGYLQRQSIFWMGRGTGLHTLYQVGKESSLITWMDRIHQSIGNQLEQLYPDSAVQGFLQGLLLGDRYEVPMEWEDQYRVLGLVHILSISGFHVSLLVGAIFLGLRWMGFTQEKSAWLIISFLPFYVILTGADPPIVRAGLMAGMVCLAIAWRKERDLISFLCLAGIIQLCWEPMVIYEPGFQLSYVVTASLIIGTSLLAERIPWGSNWLRNTIAGACVAQASSFPLIAYYFHESSLLSLLANVLFAPFFSVIVLPLAYSSLLLSYVVFPVASLCAICLTWMIQFSQSCLNWMQQINGHLIAIAHPNSVWLVGYIVLTVGVWFTWVGVCFTRSKLPWLISSIWILWIGMGIWGSQWFAQFHEITMIDVGQGDSFLIRTKSGKVILIDGGGTLPFPQKDWQKKRNPFDVGEDILVPFLTYQGVKQIDLLISTHGDADHLQGLNAVIQRFPVGSVIRNPLPTISTLEKRWIEKVRRQRIPLYIAPVGQVWEIEPGVAVTFLYPNSEDEKIYEETSNNAGVVLLFTIDQKHILFTADIEKNAEEKILKTWNLPKIDIYKVAHHGSKTSSTKDWIREIQPKYALVSVGEKNRYGHPSPEVMNRLEEVGTQIFRTDQLGAVTVRIDEGKIQITSMLQKKEE